MSGNIAYDGGGDQNLLKLAAARVIACEKMPYFAQALFAMVPVRVPDMMKQYAAEQKRLGTNGQMLGFAADAKWRFYWDPVAVERYPVEQIAGVLLHEVGHLIRHHSNRFTVMNEPARNHYYFNVSGDTLINGDLRDERIPLPDGCAYIEQIEGATREMSAEQIFYLLRKHQEEKCTCGKNKDKQESKPSDGGKDKNKEQGKDKSDEQGSEQGDEPGSGDSDDPQNENGDGQGEGQGDGGDEQGDGGNGDSDSDEQGNGQGQGQGNGQGGNQPDPNCPVHGKRKCSGNHTTDGSGEPCDGSCDHSGGVPQSWDCGSGSDGVKRDYEKEGDKVDDGVDEERGDLIRQQVALEVKNHAKNRGTVPAGLERWAKELLEPVVDWRRELASVVRRNVASVAGRKDYSYQRPSRRQAAMRSHGQNILLPAMRQPAPPIISLVVDTSGSMSDDDVTWAISEVQGVLRSIGSGGKTTRVFSCDAQVDAGKRVTNVSQVELQGGGGTDMRVGIEAAMASRPRPDVIIVLSDGGTPWPDEPLKGTTLIIGLTDERAQDSCPDWARVVLINREPAMAGRR